MTSSLKYAAAYQIQFSGIHYTLQNNHFKWKFSSPVINKGALWCRTTPESALLQICQCSTFAGKFAFCHYCIGTRLLRQSASRLQPWVALFSQTLSLKSQNLRKLKIAVKTFLILQIVVKKLSSSLGTRSSWFNCALRDDEAVCWVSIGYCEALAVGNWWYLVSRGHLCLYILHKVEIWKGVTHAWQTDWLTTLKDRATQLLIKYK